MPWGLIYALSDTTDTALLELPWADRSVELIGRTLKADLVVLTLLEGDALLPISSRGFDAELLPTPIAEQACLPCESSSEIAPPCVEIPWPWPRDASLRGSLCVPLVASGQRVGALFLGWSTEAPPGFDGAFYGALSATLAQNLRIEALEERLKKQSWQLTQVLDHIPDALLLFGTDGKVQLYNTKTAAIVGHRQWDTLGTPVHVFDLRDRHGQLLDRSEWPFLKALETGQGCANAEYILDFGEVRRHVTISITPIVDEDGAICAFIATGRDITEQREADRLKTDFLSVASHELRSPLTPLTGLLQLVRKQVEGRKVPELDLVRRAEDQTMRLRRLLDDLLDFSRIETGRLRVCLEPKELSGLMNRIMEPWLAGRHGDLLHLELPDEPVTAAVDPDRLEQVVTNLIDNALKHGREGGHVTVTLTRDDGLAVITVADEGDGIAPKTLEHIFDRFYHSQPGNLPHRTSMGLGLYICRQIIEAHGGSITIESSLGSPTIVRVEVPVA